jgi:hypothetical protein
MVSSRTLKLGSASQSNCNYCIACYLESNDLHTESLGLSKFLFQYVNLNDF